MSSVYTELLDRITSGRDPVGVVFRLGAHVPIVAPDSEAEAAVAQAE